MYSKVGPISLVPGPSSTKLSLTVPNVFQSSCKSNHVWRVKIFEENGGKLHVRRSLPNGNKV